MKPTAPPRPQAAKATTTPTQTQAPTPPDRIIALPATPLATLTPCTGIPDLLGTKLVCLAMILLFGGMMIAMSLALVYDRSTHLDFVGGLLMLLVLALFGCALAFPVYVWRHAGGWFIVDENGFRYGYGPQHGAAREAVETRVDWQDVVCNPAMRYDVTTGFTGSRSIARELRFWQRLPSGERVERRLPLRLTDAMRCLRFRNRPELLRAVLRGLAGRPELRFNAEVFVDACIDPDTWLPMGRPRFYQNLFAMLACVPVVVFIWYALAIWSIWLVIALAVGATLLLCLLIGMRWSKAYPKLVGVLGFRESEPF